MKAIRRFQGIVIFSLIAPVLIISLNNLSADAAEPGISSEAIQILTRSGDAMAEVVAAVKPSVVNISSTHTVKLRGMEHPFFNDPLFRKFFGEEFGTPQHPKESKQTSLGSGVIVRKDGYILTNYHVIKDAAQIKIRLWDQRILTGKVIGTDPKTDLAVVKIDAHDLPVLKMGHSGDMKVGETVMAIGIPFGLNQTVTSGIVSAVGRANVGIADYEDFIQTDAAINPGNSGGALVNVRGELIGINTAIFSTTGGYQGVGFAIPSDMAKVVMKDLIEKGKVTRGWLGVAIQQLTPELAKEFGLKAQTGVLVSDVTEKSPAEKAGIKRGDVIVKYNGKTILDPGELRNLVSETPPNTESGIELLRDGIVKTAKVTIAEMPASSPSAAIQPREFDNLLKGIQVQDLTPEIKIKLNIPQHIQGVIITDISGGSFAEGILSKGDVIIEIGKEKIESLKDYEHAVSRIKPDEVILLLIYRNGSTVYITLSVD